MSLPAWPSLPTTSYVAPLLIADRSYRQTLLCAEIRIIPHLVAGGKLET
jgi:hypothetical protein